MRSWVNGQQGAELSIYDRGLAYGDGLFETILIKSGQPQLMPEHMARLGKGLAALAFPDDVLKALEDDFAQLVYPEQGVMKVTVSRGTGLRGYALPKPQKPNRIISFSELPDFTAQSEQGVRIRSCQHRLALQPALAQIKHLNRLDQVMARAEWDDPAIAEGVVCDIDGYIVEGTMSNLFWVRDGVLYTPEIKGCGVRGVMRDYLISLIQQAGLAFQAGRYRPAELEAASEVFICNSVIGVWPVVMLDQWQYSVGPMTRDLQCRLHKELAC